MGGEVEQMLVEDMTLGSYWQRKSERLNKSDVGEEGKNYNKWLTHVGIVSKRKPGQELLEVLAVISPLLLSNDVFQICAVEVSGWSSVADGAMNPTISAPPVSLHFSPDILKAQPLNSGGLLSLLSV